MAMPTAAYVVDIRSSLASQCKLLLTLLLLLLLPEVIEITKTWFCTRCANKMTAAAPITALFCE